MNTTIHFNNTLNVFLVSYILLFVFRLFSFLNYLIFHQDRKEPCIQHASRSEVLLRRKPPGGVLELFLGGDRDPGTLNLYQS